MKILLTVTAFFMSGITIAQQQKMSIGLETSPSMIILRGNNFETKNDYPGIGFLGGVSCQYHLQSRFSFRSGIDFEQKGGRVERLVTDYNNNMVGLGLLPNKFDYLSLPLLMRTSLGKKMHYFAEAGVFCAYLLRQNVSYHGIEGEENRKDDDNTSLYKKIDAGVALGAGISIPVKSRLAFSLELRNELGLVNVNKTTSPVVKTNSTNLIIGLAYNFGALQNQAN